MSTGAETGDPAVRAEARLRKAEQTERDRQAAWSDIAAQDRLLDENTARLKALRLEREKADALAAGSGLAKAVKAPAKKRRRAISG